MAAIAPLIVIAGPTASGKSGLALELAERFGGEIICADSRTVYKEMNIGTAKPTPEDQARVPHHLLDVVEPNQRFTVHDFQRLAREAVSDIRGRGKTPFLVGGTGLYVDSVLLDYQFAPVDEEKRQVLSKKSNEELIMMLKNQHIPIPENKQNKRHLVHALMSKGFVPSSRKLPHDNTIVVAISTDINILEKRIRQRAEEIFAKDVICEARWLGERYGWESESMRGNIYPILRQVIEGSLTEKEAIELFIIKDRRLAKRQVTWLRRHNFVTWLSLEEARQFLDSVLRG